MVLIAHLAKKQFLGINILACINLHVWLYEHWLKFLKIIKKKPLKLQYVYLFFPFKIVIYLHINRSGSFLSCDYISGIRWGPKFELN